MHNAPVPVLEEDEQKKKVGIKEDCLNGLD
jgi:hypothetical protein